MTTRANIGTATPGDWVEVRGVHGQPSRRGQILEVLGHGEHEHYRVRWDERHESILYPADGVVIHAGEPTHSSH
ncbi:MAG: DUF1918 domain-containing protein [Solirubrobacteraceae bacterium]